MYGISVKIMYIPENVSGDIQIILVIYRVLCPFGYRKLVFYPFCCPCQQCYDCHIVNSNNYPHLKRTVVIGDNFLTLLTISESPITDKMEVSLKLIINWLTTDGITTRIAWGRIICIIDMVTGMPNERAASICPLSMDCIPLLKFPTNTRRR